MPNGGPEDRWGPWVPRIAALVATLLLVLGLGHGRLSRPWEERHAEAAASISGAGSAFAPIVDGEPYLLRPAPAVWLPALAARLLGTGTLAARLPAALCGIALVWACAALLRRIVGARTALFSAAALATTPLLAMLFRSALAEAIPISASAASFLALAVAASIPGAPSRIRWAGWILLGLAGATGGLPAVLPPVAALGLHALLGSGAAPLARLRPALGAAVAASIVALAVAPTIATHGSAGVQAFVRPDVAEESAVDAEEADKPDDRSGFDRDFEALAWGTFPWIAVFPAALGALALRSRRRSGVVPGAGDSSDEPGTAFRDLVLIWALAAFATTAVLGDRWHHLPFGALAPTAIAAGIYLADRSEEAWSVADGILLLAGLGLLFLASRDLAGGNALAQAATYFAHGGLPPIRVLLVALRVATILAGVVVFAWSVVRRRERGLSWTFAAAALGWTAVAVFAIQPNTP